MRIKTLLPCVFIVLLLCGCNQSEEVVTSSSREINYSNAISIETTNQLGEAIESTFDVRVPEYEVSEFEFNVDSMNHIITAHYDDTEVNADGYVVDINMTYYDYGVSEVSIYEASTSTRPSQFRIDLNDTEWQESLDGSSPIDTASTNINRQELSINSALSFSNNALDGNSDIENLALLLREKYDVFPFYTEYVYPIAEMNSYDNGNSGGSGREYLNMITLRANLDGLPVGVPFDNERIQMRLRFGDYYGSFFGVFDDYSSGYLSDSTNTMVNFRNYNYDLEIVPNSTANVVPLEDCISNAMPGILNEANFVGGHYCQVYAAELVYVPFSVGCARLGDFAFNINFVPVWAIYTVSSGNSARASAVYLNATTGELVSNGL